MLLFTSLVTRNFAHLRYYVITNKCDETMCVPRCKKAEPNMMESWACMDVDSITAHAHLVPDFDDATGKHYWWDTNLDCAAPF